MKKLSIEELTSLAENAVNHLKGQESYHITYPEFIEYFRKIAVIEAHHLVIGISFVYSWMPTIFDFRKDNLSRLSDLEEELVILNRAKNGDHITTEDITQLKKCFNNSFVGTSKLLHFINPEKFSIWDSRVYRFLYNNEPHSYRVEDVHIYNEYLTECSRLTSSFGYEEIHEIIEKRISQKVTQMRSLELIFYSNGAPQKKSKNKG